VRRYIHMNKVTLAEFSFIATINAPIERIDLPAWIFGLADDEYQGCSAHVATGATHSSDGRRMAINVEVLGGSVLVSHFTEEITDKHHVRLASVSDSFTPTGRTTLQVIWDMSVKAIDTNKCEFTNYVHSKPTEEFLEFLAKQGIPFEHLY
jgi:CO dehydrogenase/acetyl-CoA synthase delta subunit